LFNDYKKKHFFLNAIKKMLICLKIDDMRFLLLLAFLVASHAVSAQKINRLIRESEVSRVLSALASDDMQGRKAPSPGLEKAAAFIAEEFRKAGLKPLDPSSASHLQSFSVNQFDLTSQEVMVNGQAVPKDAQLCFPGSELVNWDNRGAEIVRILPGENAIQKLYGLIQDGKSYLVTADTSHRTQLARFRAFRAQRLDGSGTVVAVIGTDSVQSYQVNLVARKTARPYANVGAMIPGKKPDEVVVFSAHYDHLGIGKAKNQDSVFNGANDDASGTAAVIALAKYFSRMKKPERTLLFVAFTAEESGGYGSQYFSKKQDPQKVVAMFNIEMIGTDSKWGKNSAFITGYEKSDFGKLLQENLQGSAFRFEPDPYPDQNLFYRSDNATLARLGVPAHTISTSKMDSEPYYHTVDDEFETLDTKNMTEIIKAIAVSSKGIVSGKQTPRRVEMEKE
jgi:hypothetical protein